MQLVVQLNFVRNQLNSIGQQKRIFRYLKETQQYGLLYKKGDSDTCVGFSDADWGGDMDDRKSTSGYLFEVGGTAVSWKSKNNPAWHCLLQK